MPKLYSESKLTRWLCKELRAFGWHTLVLAGSKYGTVGLPDRLLCRTVGSGGGEGRSVWVEFKVGMGRLSVMQRHVCGQLAASGQTVLVVTHGEVLSDATLLSQGVESVWSASVARVGAERVGAERVDSVQDFHHLLLRI